MMRWWARLILGSLSMVLAMGLVAGCNATSDWLDKQADRFRPSTSTYANKEFAYSLDYPRGWTADDADQAFVRFRGPTPVPMITVVSIKLLPGLQRLTLEQFAQFVIEFAGIQIVDYRVLSQEIVRVQKGVSGYQVVATGKLEEGEPVIRGINLILRAGELAYLVEVATEEQRWERDGPLLESAVKSFRLSGALPTELAPTPTAVPLVSYQNSLYHHSFSLPQDWELDDSRKELVVAEGDLSWLSVSTFDLLPAEAEMTLEEWGQRELEEFKPLWVDFQLVSQGRVTLADGQPAYRIVHTGKSEQRARTVKAVRLLMKRENRAVMLRVNTAAVTWEVEEPTAEAVLASFRWPE